MKTFKTILFCLITITSYAQEFSLKDCINKVISNNPDYQRTILNAEVARAEKAQAKSANLPLINFQLYQSTNTGRSIDRFTNSYINQIYNSTYAQAGIGQNIFQANKVKNNIASGEQNIQSKLNLVEAKKNELIIETVKAYLQVLQNQELTNLASVQKLSSEKQYNRIEKQFLAGLVSKRDLLQLKTQLAKDSYQHIIAFGNEKSARLILFQLMNIIPDTLIQFQQIESKNTLFEKNAGGISSQLPEYKAAEFQIHSLESKLKSIKAENYPSLFFNANYTTFYASSNPEENFFQQINSTRNASFSLGLIIPILGRFQTRPKVQMAEINKKIAQNQLRISKRQIEQNFITAKQSFEIALQQYENSKILVEISDENLNAVKMQIDAGTVSVLEYILAKSAKDQALIGLIQAKYACIFQEKIINFYQYNSWDI